jgi:putative ABC transport system permease protein
MGVISRGVKNAFRNNARTLSIVTILAISISMALVMLVSLRAVQAKITSVKSSVGNTVTITPAGVRGFEGGGELLTEQNATDVSSIAHVSSVVKTLQDHLASDNTSLSPAIEAGSFGRRQAASDSNGQAAEQSFAMPVMVTGTSDINSLASLSVDKFNVTSGDKLDASSTNNIAMVGTELATKNNLKVDSTFKAYGQDLKVVGVFESGNHFADGSFVVPIKTLQKLSSQENQINTMIVQVDSIDNVSVVAADVKTKLADKADVTTSADATQTAVAPLENIRSISLYSLIGSLAAGAIIIFLIMIMIVRERRQEIGILKAIGASNAKVVAQFMSESLVFTLLGSVLGIILGFFLANPVLKMLLNNATSSTTGPGPAGGHSMSMAGMAGMMHGAIGGAQSSLQNLQATVGFDLILYGILAALAIAVLGSAIPAFFISKVRPAEVMRSE